MTDTSPPFYSAHIFCCTNLRDPSKRVSCGGQHADKLRDYLKDRVKDAGIPSARVNTAGCFNRCELGPVMVIYPEGVWYHYETHEDVDEIVREHLVRGKTVERLLLPAGTAA